MCHLVKTILGWMTCKSLFILGCQYHPYIEMSQLNRIGTITTYASLGTAAKIKWLEVRIEVTL